MLHEKDPDVLVTVRKLVMVSLMEVFKDIVPGYHLRQPTEQEQKQKVSRLVGKPTMWFPIRSDTNQAVQAKKVAREWAFLI